MPNIYEINDLIMIKNTNSNTYYWANYSTRIGETPVFKVLPGSMGTVLHLELMEVIYPASIYVGGHRKGAIQAVKDETAAVKGTKIVKTVNLDMQDVAEIACINEITEIAPIMLKELVVVDTNFHKETVGAVQAKTKKGKLHYRLTTFPANGKVKLDKVFGTWVYIPGPTHFERESFEITVFNDLGGVAIQRVILVCKKTEPSIYDVNILNKTLHMDGHVKVTNTPDVRIKGLSPISGALPITIPDIGNLEGAFMVTGVVDLAPEAMVQVTVNDALPVSIANVEILEGALMVTGVVDLAPEAMVQVTANDALPVSIANVEILEGALMVSGMVDLASDAVVTVTSLEPLPVSILNVDTIFGAIVVTGVMGLDDCAKIEITASEALPVTILDLVNLNGALMVTGLVDLAPEASVQISAPEALPITGMVNLDPNAMVNVTGIIDLGPATHGLTTIMIYEGNIEFEDNVGFVTTEAVDVSMYEWYTYVFFINGNELATDVTYQIKNGFKSPTGDFIHFIQERPRRVHLEDDGTLVSGHIRGEEQFLQYQEFYLYIEGPGLVGGSATVYLQGKY